MCYIGPLTIALRLWYSVRVATTPMRSIRLDDDTCAYAAAIAERAGLGPSLSDGIRLAVAELYRQQIAAAADTDLALRVAAIEVTIAELRQAHRLNQPLGPAARR